MASGREIPATQKFEDEPEEESSDELDEHGYAYHETKPIINFYDDEDRGFYPETIPRRCQDCLWLPVYLVFASVFAVICYAGINHNLVAQRVWVARDYRFQQCGIGDNVGKPYLYFCLEAYFADEYLMDNKQVNTQYPICVEDCPNSWLGTMECYVGNNTFRIVKTYKTHHVQGICEPTAGTAGNSIFRAIMDYYFEHRFFYGMAMLLARSWVLVVSIGVSSLFLAIAYVMTVARYAKQIIWTGLCAIGLLPLGISIHIFYSHHTGGGLEGLDGARVMAWLLLAVSLLLFYCICSVSSEIEKAIICMSWFGKCISTVSSLKCSPLIRAVSEVAVVAFHTYVFFCIWSKPPGSLDEQIAPLEEFTNLLGRHVCAAFVVLMLLWHIGLVQQVNNVALIYAVQTWFFQGGMSSHGGPGPSITRGYWVAVRYHLGSCYFAGLVTKLVAPVRFPLKVVTGVLRWENNPVGFLLRICFGWVEDCFYDNCEGLSSHSLYDVVLQANSWCDAVKHSTAVVNEEGGVGHILEGATWIFELAGIATFALVSYNVAQLFLQMDSYYSDPTSDGFIALPFMTSGMCLLTGVLCSYPFMDMFRLVSDCILYCRTVEKQRTRLPAQGGGGGFDPERAGCTDEFASVVQRLLCMDGRQRGL